MVSSRTRHIENEKRRNKRVDKNIRRNEGYKKGGKTKLKSGGKTPAVRRRSGGKTKK